MLTQINVLGVKVNYDLPTTLEEALELPGCTKELIFKSFLKQALYHGTYGAFRPKITQTLEEDGLGKREYYFKKKLVHKITDGQAESWQMVETGKVLTPEQITLIEVETDARFFARVCALAGNEPSAYTGLIQKVVDSIPFDVTRRERTIGEKTANKKHLKLAVEIADNGALERVAGQLSIDLGYEINVSGDRDEAINTLALAIGENERREEEQRKNKYLTLGA